MTLKNYCSLVKGEIEVWDQYVDIGTPYYNFNGENCFGNTDEDHHLFLMENWFLNLEVTTNHDNVCSVDCFTAIKEVWPEIVENMRNDKSYFSFLSSWEDINDDEAIAEYVEDVFSCLSQGYYNMAKDFCHFLKLEEKYLEGIAADVCYNRRKVVDIEQAPDCDEVFYYCLDELTNDISHGTGNVIVYYIFIPALDLVCRYCSY